MEVRGDEQRVVVEHLLEVRDEPALVDRVAVEAAADEVVHAAGGHRVERALAPSSCSPRRSRNSSVDAGGNLGAPPKPPQRGSNVGADPAHGLVQERLGERLRRTARASLAERIASSSDAGLARDVVAAVAVGVGDADEQLAEAGSPCRGSGGKYVPPKNGSPSGVRKTVIGQPPLPVSATTASM